MGSLKELRKQQQANVLGAEEDETPHVLDLTIHRTKISNFKDMSL